MTVPPALVFPGGRTLAGWWKQLERWQPQALWCGHLLLHRVEALAAVTRSQPLAPFPRLLLQALALGAPATPAEVDARLHLGPHVTRQALRRLAAPPPAR